jgi:hypothetical protein
MCPVRGYKVQVHNARNFYFQPVYFIYPINIKILITGYYSSCLNPKKRECIKHSANPRNISNELAKSKKEICQTPYL